VCCGDELLGRLTSCETTSWRNRVTCFEPTQRDRWSEIGDVHGEIGGWPSHASEGYDASAAPTWLGMSTSGTTVMKWAAAYVTIARESPTE